MRFDIDLSQNDKRLGPSRELALEGLLTIVTSTAFIALLMGVLVLGIGYFAVFVPLFSVPPVHKDQLRDLRLLQKGVEQQREGLLGEARAALRVQMEAPGWSQRLKAAGELVPDGVWLNRVALEEDQTKGARRRPGGQQGQPEPVRTYLVVEGRVDARRFPSPLEPISRYLKGLNEDPRIRDVADLQLVWSASTKDDPLVVGFQLKGLWNPEAMAGKPEDRIQAKVKARATRKGPGS